ncbi:MAG: leucine-rich repeat domain-containing protein, partial [Oscillospiraceae bacterium]|nr:leucine-rich repeat domain-containing protein [Oscillospiraceae bacterium]
MKKRNFISRFGAVIAAVSMFTASFAGTTVNAQTAETVPAAEVTQINAASTLQGIISAAVTSSMTNAEKAEAVTKYVADNYSYNGSYQSYTDILKYGGGDCWANQDILYELFELLGIKSIRHDDAGEADSGHVNNIIYTDGKYYLCDAGYSGSAPRYYRFSEIGTVPFAHYDGRISRYYGFETNVVIPEKIGDTTITAIGKNTFTTSLLTSFHLINSKLCFEYWGWEYSRVETISIPSTVTDIENGAFKYSMLKNISLPDSITVINPNTFDYSENLEYVIIPESVKTIHSAFNNCPALDRITINSKDCVFDSTNGTVIPKAVTIYGYSNSTADEYAQSNGNVFISIDGGHSHKYSGSWLSDSTGHWKECTICGDKEVIAHTSDEGTVTKPATADEEGEKTYKCTECKYV